MKDLLGPVFRRLYARLIGDKRRSKDLRIQDQTRIVDLSALRDSQMIVNYSRSPATLLDSLCDRHGSDKGGSYGHENPFPWKKHTYTDFLSLLFDSFREEVNLVFECGIGTTNSNIPANMGPRGTPGASLRVWRDYFPNAEIVGADIDETILFNEERITTYWVDQSNSAKIREMWKRIDKTGFQLMIDDGLHTFEAGKTLFLASVDRLAANGTYIIEDVQHEDMIRYMDFFSSLKFRVSFVSLLRPPENEKYSALGDNQLILIRPQ